MRVLIWNMGKRRVSWDYVRRNAASFDVALLQETRDPASSLEDQWRSVIWRPRSRVAGAPLARWGSAVVAPALELEQYEPGEGFPWLRELDGCVAVARWAQEPNWFASVHAQASAVPPKVLARHPYDQVPRCTRGRKVWQMDLIPFELHKLFEDQTFIWGGDLNSAERMDDDPRFAGGNRRLREIWSEAGSCDLRLRFFADEQQTFFSPVSGPYQLDHVFADRATEARVVDWRVDTEPVLNHPEVSDHAPIWVELK
jgi:hypothetical protein